MSKHYQPQQMLLQNQNNSLWKQQIGSTMQISEYPISCLAILKQFVFAATNKKVIGLRNVPNTQKVISVIELEDAPIQLIAKSDLLFVLCKGSFIVYQLGDDLKLGQITSKKKERKEFIKMEWYSEVDLMICDLSGELYLFNIENFKFNAEISGNLGLDYGLKTFAINNEIKKIIAAGIGHDLKCYELNTFEEEQLEMGDFYNQTIDSLSFFRNILFVDFHNRISLYKIESAKDLIQQQVKHLKTIQTSSQQLAYYQMDESKIVLGNNSATDSKGYIWVYVFDSNSAKHPFKTIPNNDNTPFIEINERIASILYTDEVLIIGSTNGKIIRFEV